MTQNKFKQVSGYVMQDDALLGHLTPRELLRFSARLRLPRTMTKKEQYARVEEAIGRLNLQKCADTRIGIPGIKRGISGGERKRTSIALELLTNPMLLFLDEPTSGLDSNTALFLIRHLHFLAAEGRSIICTIHQPSSEMVLLFDDIFWLTEGKLVYSGPVKEMPQYFEDAGFPCPHFVNPSDHVMSVISGDEGEAEQNVKDRIQLLLERFEKNNNILPLDALATNQEGVSSNQDKRMLWPFKFWTLFLRSFVQRLRDPGSTFQRLINDLVVSLFIGLLFLQLGHDQRGKIFIFPISFYLSLPHHFFFVLFFSLCPSL